MGNCIAYAPKEMLWIFSLHWNVLNCVKFRSQVWGSDFTVSQTKNLYFILFVLFCLFCHYGRQCCKLGNGEASNVHQRLLPVPSEGHEGL